MKGWRSGRVGVVVAVVIILVAIALMAWVLLDGRRGGRVFQRTVLPPGQILRVDVATISAQLPGPEENKAFFMYFNEFPRQHLEFCDVAVLGATPAPRSAGAPIVLEDRDVPIDFRHWFRDFAERTRLVQALIGGDTVGWGWMSRDRDVLNLTFFHGDCKRGIVIHVRFRTPANDAEVSRAVADAAGIAGVFVIP